MLSAHALADLNESEEKLESALTSPNYEEMVLLTAYWALMDWCRPTGREPMPVKYTAELYDISRAAKKYKRSRFDDRRGLGVPRHRHVKVRGLGKTA
jgi:hypothetical protein